MSVVSRPFSWWSQFARQPHTWGKYRSVPLLISHNLFMWCRQSQI